MTIEYLDAKRIQGQYNQVNSDSLGSGANGTNSGASLESSSVAIFGQSAFDFDGSSDYATIG